MARINHNIFTGTGLVLLGLFALVQASLAADPLFSAVGFEDSNNGLTISIELTPIADINVTHLGVLDGGSDGPGLGVAHDVGLWTAAGILLATTTVDNSGTLQDGHRYAAITPVVLSAGQTYTLGAYYPLFFTGDKLIATIFTPPPFVSLNTEALLEPGQALAFPFNPTIITDFPDAANLLFDPVDTSRIDISGTIKTPGGLDICAMVLASGKFMFSCNPTGVFSLNNLPRETNGTVKLQIFADGFLPFKNTLVASGSYPVTMTPAGTCPNYNPPSNPGVFPGSAGQVITISGNVLVGSDGTTPVCAMVLANGQHMFSCGGAGSYSLNVPLDTNGQVKLQVYADGFAPYIERFDEFNPVNNALLARASECS